MAVKHKTRVNEIASNKPNAATAFGLPGSAATGFRTFASAYVNNDQLPYHATNGTDWESGIGTFTTGPSTLTRTQVLESSNADAAVDFSAGADVALFVEWPAKIAAIAHAELSNYIRFSEPRNYISRASATSLSLVSGEAIVNGELLVWTSAITWSGTSGTAPLNAAQLVHWYLYSDSGVATLEASTTAPIWDSGLSYAKKTGDTSRRWVFTGYVYSGVAGKRIVPFTASCVNNLVSVVYEGEYVDASNNFNVQGTHMAVVSAGTATTLTAFTLSFAPDHVHEAYLGVKVVATANASDLAAGVTQSDQTGAGAADITYVASAYRGKPALTGEKYFFGHSWVSCKNKTMYYNLFTYAGSGNMDVLHNGYKAAI